ncbi:type 2 isopentenyl-diphosphate Delta-isomerase [Bacillus sp. Marseille-Q3570]|uniref:type 2 isopentenyl-diphosphate Delta-isomerase n=1 Tax=Bacillus sp. Marseille-Q3570 TaxID=2963522 RepID=UPI0021B748D9|nr:type 2 isopentenyl-diphosphate Delta-isomerase [Bacillus sp. Marseille-Q3570]
MEDNMKDQTLRRKDEHIDIALHKPVQNENTTGFEKYRFRHNPLPEIDFEAIDLSTSFLDKKLNAPFLVSSMTGGTDKAKRINEKLAEIAEEKGWSIGVGSMRAAIEEKNSIESFQIRKYAPTVALLANLGAVQLNYGFGVDECRRAVDLIEADGLVLHLNSLQEVFQPEGNTNFTGLLKKIESVIEAIEVPVGVKEVGMGIDGLTAKRLVEAGVDFIDVAGAGGTSWIQVEKYRNQDLKRYQAADAFRDWGNPTSSCLEDIKKCGLNAKVISSGGMQNGVEAAKAIALGADLVGFGGALLPLSVGDDRKRMFEQFERIEFELKAAMFGIGQATIEQLKFTQWLEKK